MSDADTIKALISENLCTDGVAEGRTWLSEVKAVLRFQGLSSAAITAALWAGHQRGEWNLHRCDLVGAAPAGAVASSEIEVMGCTFHTADLNVTPK